MTEQQNVRHERSIADQHAWDHLSAEDHDLWLSYRAANRFTLSKTAEVFHWEVVDGKQVIGSTYCVQDVHASFDTGLSVCVRELETGKTQNITHIPAKLLGTDLFVWVPYLDAAHWHLIKGRFQLCVSVAVRMPHSASNQKDGAAYLTRKPSL